MTDLINCLTLFGMTFSLLIIFENRVILIRWYLNITLTQMIGIIQSIKQVFQL